MFIGEYTTAKTSGNRIAIPKVFREELNANGLVMTRGYENCVVLVSKDSFSSLIQDVNDLPFTSGDKRESARFLLGSAHEVTPDEQGRVVVPASLLLHAGIEAKDVVFIGVGTWVELWDKERWQKYQQELDENAAEIANRLSDLKI